MTTPISPLFAINKLERKRERDYLLLERRRRHPIEKSTTSLHLPFSFHLRARERKKEYHRLVAAGKAGSKQSHRSRLSIEQTYLSRIDPLDVIWIRAPLEIETVILLDEDDDQPVNSVDMEKDEHGWIGSKIYYPSRDHAECVEICYSDMKCLAPCSYLSSPIMNFYIQYLQRVQIETGKARIDYQFFNTYFYNKLEEALAYKGPQDDDSFIKLRRWWKGINIFEKSFIFLPIHSDEHWSLVIICIPAIEDEQGPIIIHLDSLGLHNSKLIFGNVERYLVKEWEHLKDELSLPDLPISYRVWRQLPSKIKSKKIEVPQQDNPYDCGLFVLYFIQRFIEDAPERVRMKDLSMFGRKWFKPEEASRLRQHLKRLLKIQFERVGLLDNARPCTP